MSDSRPNERLLSLMASAALMLLLLLSQLWLSAYAAEPDFLPPDQAFRFSYEQSEQGDVLLHWEIEPGYYLYQQRFRVTDAEKNPLTDLQFLHKPKQKDDPNFGRVAIFHDEVSIRVRPLTDTLLVSYQGCAEGGLCYPPRKQQIAVTPASAIVATDTSETAAPVVADEAELGVQQDAGAIASLLADADGYWVVLTFLALGLGLAFTPCVLPMVPILAAIIAGQGTQITVRRGIGLSVAYVLGMSATYTLAGVLVGYFGARMNLQAALQSPVALVLFSGLFVALALAMLGFYELQLPAFLRDRLDRMSRNSSGGRYAGVALMGLISALVVSPCVSAPLAGALVYISTTGDALLGGASLFALSLGMGVPLILVGAGGGKWLPKAGGWMLEVKAFFGVLLLGVAISLISRMLPGSVTLILWAMLIITYAAHVGNWGETVKNGWGKTRLGFSVVLLSYGLSLLVGGLAGQQDILRPLSFMAGTPSAAVTEAPLFSRFRSVAELQQAQRAAQEAGRPVVVDLYADWCASCAVMEKNVFQHPDVRALGTHVTFLQLDMTANEAEHTAYLQAAGLFGPPAMLFFRADGRENQSLRVQGELNAQQFAGRVRALL